MVSARRPTWSWGLERAASEAERLKRPLYVLEALRCDYPWASERLHRFVMEGMADNAAWFAGRGVGYYPYVEPRPGEGRGLLSALAAGACLVVTDEPFGSFLTQMVESAAAQLPVRVESVDGNGIFPVFSAPRAFPTARGWRGFLHRELGPHLSAAPMEDPLLGRALPPALALPGALTRRWPAWSGELGLSALPVDRSVRPVGERGGWREAERRFARFLESRLSSYADRRNDPANSAASGLSPYLHFGHISPHRVLRGVLDAAGWSPDRIQPRMAGQREGWWGAPPAVEGLLEQLITWRELGFNACALLPGWDRYESLPEWARRTLEIHRGDRRERRYPVEALSSAATHDPVWNAAQRQLKAEGRIQNYLRMLWGKKVLEWSESPEAALSALVELNNRWALDGRDPNSYSGIFWVFGRYDRAWGPERPIFGTVRYMSSDSTRRKMDLSGYLDRYGQEVEDG